ncbi:MAG TPA: preprotein translocase subunit SecE [Spirochaetota bacterium]|jgi:preprotein translocase subunit SecE|nr:MAG: preprotein translocase subunit SecE [Spirochaetes bacterium ADurb.Bin133]HNZ26210.1 preprotein translocase subunit SecE [Spirochaetota bacterium]HPY87085.1 preprotein translocase subunit SecE [Spirochaetota bacterium]HQB62328.1 preprotein translocase subunit SecE [Spirochaetota bacterium]
MKKIIDFVRESFAELKKVSWPSREDVASQTVVVVVSLIIVSMLLTVIDFLSLEAISKIITLGM